LVRIADRKRKPRPATTLERKNLWMERRGFWGRGGFEGYVADNRGVGGWRGPLAHSIKIGARAEDRKTKKRKVKRKALK